MSVKEEKKKKNTGSQKWRSFLLTIKLLFRTPTGAAGFIIMLFYIGTALILQFAPNLIGITDPGYMQPNFANPFPQPPSSKYPFGTTYPGIDLFPAVFKAIRIDVFSAIAIVGAGAIIGTVIGVIWI